MEIMVFFSLLLLVCSVSTNQTEADNEILDQQISNQQPCPQDIHAVLREMAVSLALQTERITVLQKENQDQTAKLKEMGRQKTEIDQLKLQSKEQAAKLETEIDQLKLHSEVKQVAFSASLVNQGREEIGPFTTRIILIFKRVVTNIGNAYNPYTGIFTAPVRGVYHFDWKVFGYGNIRAAAVLFRNGEHIFLAEENPTSGYVSASDGASLLLEVGDQVSVRLWTHSRIFDDQNHHTSFSGHLIFTM
ncbi:complement C1q-like protein 3 isoform X2 [Oreochromis aureus]|uniref:C1q domain-containing protein n=1 Tax=Oreochromis aureus TaxID=47969 RepID=A0AAZ1XLA4_OREAU|nr:complement C1q-like protein 3 isoform X2 [Oreochromis aureus]